MSAQGAGSSRKTCQENGKHLFSDGFRTDDEKLRSSALASKETDRQSSTQQTNSNKQTTDKIAGQSGVLLRQKENNTSKRKQINVAISSKGIAQNKHRPVKKSPNSGILSKENKEPVASSSKAMSNLNSKVVNETKTNRKPTKIPYKSTSEDSPLVPAKTPVEDSKKDYMKFKKAVGHSGIALRIKETKSKINVLKPSKQTDQKETSEIKMEQDSGKGKSKLGSTSKESQILKSQTIEKSEENSNPTKKALGNALEGFSSELCKTLLDNIPEDIMVSPSEPVSHPGIKFIPKSRKKSSHLKINIKPQERSIASTNALNV